MVVRQARDRFRPLHDTGANDHDIETALDKFNGHFQPRVSRVYEIYESRHAQQGPQEAIDQFHIRLRGMGKM